jgi:hypothetical protein
VAVVELVDPRRGAQLALGPRLADRQVHVLGAPAELVGAARLVAEEVAGREQGDVALAVGALLDL